METSKMRRAQSGETIPQFANEALATSGQISGVDGDEVIRRFALFPLPAGEEKHLEC